MLRKYSRVLVAALISGLGLIFTAFRSNSGPFEAKGTVYDYKIKTLDGEEITLAKYKGKKLLLVNVASKCGFTPQYKNLEALSEKYGDKLIVIGFPANNFGAQEPGNSGEIREFCTKNYGVKFPMMEKISVRGKDQHPLYQYLSHRDQNGIVDDSPSWNFCKYLIDEKGQVIKFFSSKVDPMSEEITSLL